MYLNDVTLRESDQMTSRDFSPEQKITAGLALDELGVEFLQAGFPITGERDQEVIAGLAGDTSAKTIGLARAIPTDVDAVVESGADIVEVIIPLSDLQLEFALDTSRDQATRMAQQAVDHARDRGATVHITVVDAFRTDPDHLVSFIELFPDIPYVNFADTVGSRTPQTVREILEAIGNTVNLDRMGVHFHDDLGVATANTLTAYELGVGKADVSVASLGERVGNPALEEVVVAGVVEYEDDFGLDASELIPACERVLLSLGESVEPRKPILGEEATKHESGIHTAAMLKEPSVFEPFNPERFGGERQLLFGSGTGRSSARILLQRADIEPTEKNVDELLTVLQSRGPIKIEEAVALTSERFDQ